MRQHIGGRAAGRVHDSEPDAVPLLQLVLGQAGLAQETVERLRRRAGAGTFKFFADGGRFQGQAAHDQGQPARSHEALDGGRLQPGLGQFVREQARQIVRCLQLHARGNFLAAQFEEEVSHTAVHPGNFSFHSSQLPAIHSMQLPLAISRTRLM